METKVCKCKQNVTDGRVQAIVDGHEKRPASLIPVLQAIQEEYGYLPETSMDVVGRCLGVSVSNIFGVATFYKQFRLTPQGKYIIKVCHGTACHVAGANGISTALSKDLDVEDGGTTEDLNFTLESVACLGCCSLAPVMMVSDKTYGRLTPEKAKKVVAGKSGVRGQKSEVAGGAGVEST